MGLDQVRIAGSGSAPLSDDVLVWFRALGLELLEGYGMSENFGYSHGSRPGQVRVGYVGSPYDGVECKLGSDGEVLVKSPATMLGYFEQPSETRQAISEDGFLKTGDCGVIDELGRLRLAGRVKEIFKTSKGMYVAPAPIENVLLANPVYEQCCVTGGGQAQPFALVALSAAARSRLREGKKSELERELADHLLEVNRELDKSSRLQFLCVVAEDWTADNGLLTPTMKIKRSKLEAAYQSRVPGWYRQERPIVWAETLAP